MSRLLSCTSLPALFPTITLLLSLVSALNSKSPTAKNAILLSSVRALTLRSNQETSHRRVPAISQLRCIGGNACDLYTVDVMRCTNQGSDYNDENIQWTCVADLPPEFKLGSTEVICEGYRNADDDYVLKGSCGVEYRLLLTDRGEERYGKRRYKDRASFGRRTWGEFVWDIFNLLKVLVVFVGIFVCIILLFAWLFPDSRRGPRAGEGGGGWNGWGGGGGGGGPDDPPPPYDWRPSRKPFFSSSSWQRPAGGGWEPGFWTGALGGGAAGYAMGSRGYNRGNGEGSSRSMGYGATGSGASYSSSTRESTGFGGTRRR